jgi:predicted enzyme related to lactoylglutathione lyase
MRVASIIALSCCLIAADAADDGAAAKSEQKPAVKQPTISVVSIPVADQARAKAFYVDKLGFVVKSEADMGQAKWIQLAPSAGAEATVALVTWFPEMKPGCVQGLVLDVADIAAARKALVDKGVAVGEVEAMPYGKFADFKDADGNGWMLHQP